MGNGKLRLPLRAPDEQRFTAAYVGFSACKLSHFDLKRDRYNLSLGVQIRDYTEAYRIREDVEPIDNNLDQNPTTQGNSLMGKEPRAAI